MTPNCMYASGANLERKARQHLADIGYPTTMRAAGSHGPADLCGLGPEYGLMVQVKKGPIGKAEVRKALEQLGAMVLPSNVFAELWVWADGGWDRYLA